MFEASLAFSLQRLGVSEENASKIMLAAERLMGQEGNFFREVREQKRGGVVRFGEYTQGDGQLDIQDAPLHFRFEVTREGLKIHVKGQAITQKERGRLTAEMAFLAEELPGLEETRAGTYECRF